MRIELAFEIIKLNKEFLSSYDSLLNKEVLENKNKMEEEMDEKTKKQLETENDKAFANLEQFILKNIIGISNILNY